MNYLKIYVKLIRKAESRSATNEGYREKHHVFPVSLYGKNSRIVVLTPREHYLAHLLLWKGFCKRYSVTHFRTMKMKHAARMMVTTKCPNRPIINSRWLDVFRKHNSERIKGNSNPAKLPDVRKKISASKIGMSRSDMAGKSYMGSATPKEAIIEKSVQTRKARMVDRLEKTGKKLNSRPPGYKNGPHKESTKAAISEARLKTSAKYIAMTQQEFESWLHSVYIKGKFYRKHGPSGNVSRALKYRNETLNDYPSIPAIEPRKER